MLRHLVAPQSASLCSVPSVTVGLAASAVVFFIASGAAYWPKLADKKSDEERIVTYLAPNLPTGKSMDTAGVRWAPSNAEGFRGEANVSKYLSQKTSCLCAA
jgi:hypothetical protein